LIAPGSRGLRVKLILPALKEATDPQWRPIKYFARASVQHGSLKHQAKHFFYAAGWKKFEPVWDLVIRAKQLNQVTPVLEGVLSRVTGRPQVRAQEEAAVLLAVIQP